MEFQAVTLAYLRGMLFSHNDCFIVVSENGIFIYYQALQSGSALFEKKSTRLVSLPDRFTPERDKVTLLQVLFFFRNTMKLLNILLQLQFSEEQVSKMTENRALRRK